MATVTKLGGFSNCFLVRGNGGSVLVDCGAGAQRRQLFNKLRNEPLTLILLTHCHADHTANAAFLRRLFRVPVAMHEADAEALHSGRFAPMQSKGALGGAIRRLARGAALPAEMKDFVPDLLVREGDLLDRFGVAAVVHELRGHTAGSVGLLVEGDGLIAGDAAFALPRPAPAPLYENRQRMLQSYRRMGQLNAGTIYVGHGRPFAQERLHAADVD